MSDEKPETGASGSENPVEGVEKPFRPEGVGPEAPVVEEEAEGSFRSQRCGPAPGYGLGVGPFGLPAPASRYEHVAKGVPRIAGARVPREEGARRVLGGGVRAGLEQSRDQAGKSRQAARCRGQIRAGGFDGPCILAPAQGLGGGEPRLGSYGRERNGKALGPSGRREHRHR